MQSIIFLSCKKKIFYLMDGFQMDQEMVWLEGWWSLQDILWQLHLLLFIQISLKTIADCRLTYWRGIGPSQVACLSILKKIKYLQIPRWLPSTIFLLGLGGCSYISIPYPNTIKCIDSLNLVWFWCLSPVLLQWWTGQIIITGLLLGSYQNTHGSIQRCLQLKQLFIRRIIW